MTPICASPSAPPPSKTRPIFCLGTAVAEGWVLVCVIVPDRSSFDCAMAATPSAAAPARTRTKPRQNAKFNIRSPCVPRARDVCPESCRFFRFLQGFVRSHLDLTLGEACFRQPVPAMAPAVPLFLETEKAPVGAPSFAKEYQCQISRITGMISGRRLVLFWMNRFRSVRIFSLMTP
jgi:hypothetical protein